MYERCNSPLGRNAVFCMQYLQRQLTHLLSSKLRYTTLRRIFVKGLPHEVRRQADSLMEAVAVHDGALWVPGFSDSEMRSIINELSRH